MDNHTDKIKFIGSEYNVNYVDHAGDADDEREGIYLFGTCDSVRRDIRISTLNPDGNQLKDHEINVTYFHELIHAILGEGKYDDPENMVEWIARCLAELKENGGL